MPSLDIKDVVVSYEGVRALDGVSVSISEAGITGLIGPNGAGKTTLLDVVSGFVRPIAGSCKYGDVSLTSLSPTEISRHGIGRTFQTLRLVRQVSVRENVLLAFPDQGGETLFGAFLMRYRRQEPELSAEATRLLEAFGLEELGGQLAGQLSFGQQKLLTLACVFATKSRLLLLDEPVAGIHPDIKDLILYKLREIATDCSIIMIEHDLDAVRLVAQRVIVMDQGQIVAEGGPDEVLELPEVLEAYVG